MAKQVHFIGYWPDGTQKLAGPDGAVLPKGTNWSIRGGRVYVTSPTGAPIQVKSNGQIGTPVDELTDLPSGSYDPGLLYQSQDANLGNLYGHQDYDTQWQGYHVGPDGQIQRPGDMSTAGRGIADYFRNTDRENQDYATATGELKRQYGVLANNQLQAINASGTLGGGALAQALAKRSANQAREQAGMNTTHTRSLSNLLTGATRGHADDFTTLSRSDQSNALYQGGLFGTATAQANQSGMLVDNPNYEVHNGVTYLTAPDGSLKPVKAATDPAEWLKTHSLVGNDWKANQPARSPTYGPNANQGTGGTRGPDPVKVSSPFGKYKPRKPRNHNGSF